MPAAVCFSLVFLFLQLNSEISAHPYNCPCVPKDSSPGVKITSEIKLSYDKNIKTTFPEFQGILIPAENAVFSIHAFMEP